MIKAYRFGSINVDGHSYDKDLIIYPDKVNDSWRRKEGHTVNPDDVKEIIASKPEVVIFGKGTPGFMKLSDEARTLLENEGIEVIILSTTKAVDKYNEIYKDKKVVAALHLTC